jgi:hypothetical protein
MRAVRGTSRTHFGSPNTLKLRKDVAQSLVVIVESLSYQWDLRGKLQIDYGSNPPVNLKESRDLFPRQYLLEKWKVFHSQLNG